MAGISCSPQVIAPLVRAASRQEARNQSETEERLHPDQQNRSRSGCRKAKLRQERGNAAHAVTKTFCKPCAENTTPTTTRSIVIPHACSAGEVCTRIRMEHTSFVGL